MIFIDAGHGGKDSGAVGNSIKEKDLALQLALIQKRIAQIWGIKSIIVRFSDVDMSINQRANHINSLIEQLKGEHKRFICISNHINDASNKSAYGFEIIKQHKDNSGYAEKLIELVKRSDILAVRKVYSKLGKSGLDYFGMNRLLNCPSYILEWGFIKNQNDMNSLRNNIMIACTLPLIAYLQTEKQ